MLPASHIVLGGITMRFRCLERYLRAFGACAVIATVASAQAPKAQPPFTFVLVDTFQYTGADAMIVRRPNQTPHDLIVVNRDRLRPSLLAEAATLLKVVRLRDGDAPKQNVLIRVPTPQKIRRLQVAAVDWARTIERRPRRQVPGFGLGSTLTIDSLP
jgi:hypothetical protein